MKNIGTDMARLSYEFIFFNEIQRKIGIHVNVFVSTNMNFHAINNLNVHRDAW